MIETLIHLMTNLTCAIGIGVMAPTLATTGTTVECLAPEAVTESYWEGYEAHEDQEQGDILAYYNGDVNHITISDNLTLEYTVEVLWHEFAHAWDLQKGTELNGYPSFFSETHTGFDVEQFARLQTLYLGEWPEGETFPDTIPTEAEFAQMAAAGWLIER